MLDCLEMWSFLLLVFFSIVIADAVHAEPIKVRTPEAAVRGFLALSTTNGEALAHGALAQTLRRGLVESRLTFHFKDGSLYQEVAVFSQRRTFQLLTYKQVQKGPSFKTQETRVRIRSLSIGDQANPTRH